MSTQDESDKNTQNTGLESLRLAIQQGYSKYGMIDGFGDVYTDETGVDGATSTNEIYDATGDYYTPEKGQNLLIQSEESTTVVDGDKDFYDITRFSATSPPALTGSPVTVVPTDSSSPYGDNTPYVNFPLSASHMSFGTNDTDQLFPTGDFTIQGWFRKVNPAAYGTLMGKYNGAAGGGGGPYYLNWNNSGVIKAHFRDAPHTNSVTLNYTHSVASNTWAHICFTRTGDVFRLYVDGTERDSVTESITGSTLVRTLEVGSNNGLDSYALVGDACDVEIIKGTAIVPDSGGPSSSPGPHANSVFYLGHNITNTTFVDSTGVHTVTALGDATHSLAQSKFGSSSLRVGGVNGGLQMSDTGVGGDFDFGSGDFTIEAWVYFDALGSDEMIFQKGSTSTSNVQWRFLKVNSNNLRFSYSTSGTAYTTNITSSGTLSATTWTHVAVVNNGGTISFYVDGTADATTGSSGAIADGTGNLRVGVNAENTQDMTGYLEEILVLKGVASYTTNFTPPTEPYTPDIFDMTLVSNSETADSVPSSVRSVMLYDPVSATTLGTDFTLEVSRDGGTTFTELTLSKSADYDANVEILTTDSTSISAQPSGTGVVYRIKTLNDKDVRVHGVYFQWA